MSENWSLSKITDRFAYLCDIPRQKASNWLGMTDTQSKLDYIVNKSTDDPKANLLILMLFEMALKFGDYNNPHIPWLHEQIDSRRKKLLGTVYSIKEAKLLKLPTVGVEPQVYYNSLPLEGIEAYGTAYYTNDPYKNVAGQVGSALYNPEAFVNIKLPEPGLYPIDNISQSPWYSGAGNGNGITITDNVTVPAPVWVSDGKLYPQPTVQDPAGERSILAWLTPEESTHIRNRRLGVVEKEVIIEVQPIKKGRKFKGVF